MDKRMECMMINKKEAAKKRVGKATRLRCIADIVREWEEVIYPETTEALREYVKDLLDKS